MSTSGDRQAVSSLQDVFLNGARRERLRVTVRLMDGAEICGRIKSFDRYALLVEHDESDVLLFKHAVATIRPAASLLSGRRPAPDSGVPSDRQPAPGPGPAAETSRRTEAPPARAGAPPFESNGPPTDGAGS